MSQKFVCPINATHFVQSSSSKNILLTTLIDLDILIQPLNICPNLMATSCKELTHWKRLWCWEGLRAGGKGDNRGWDGWMASLTRWTWAWVNSGRWWWIRRPGVLQFMGSQRVGHDWVTELNCTELNSYPIFEPVCCSRPCGKLNPNPKATLKPRL